MSEVETGSTYRADIALRTRRRVLDGRLRKLSVAIFGLLGYSGFSNFFGALSSLGSAIESPEKGVFNVILGLLLGSLYSFGAYRVWLKDDLRWWPVGIPAAISIALSTIMLAAGQPAVLLVLLINIALLAMVPIRKRAAAAAAAIASKPLSESASFKDV